MRVLVAFESSGTVRQAFRDRGHNAWSCDLLPADDGSAYHLQMDASEAITIPNIDEDIFRHCRRDWDLIIMHPPCTALCVSGNAHYGTGKPKHRERVEAIAYTISLFEKAKQCAQKVCMENPVGVLPMKPKQYIQPHQYGHPESKKTGLWLHNLSPLQPTNVLDLPECGYWDNQTPSRQNKLGPSEDRWKVRSKTYQGIADAMAEQWG